MKFSTQPPWIHELKPFEIWLLIERGIKYSSVLYLLTRVGILEELLKYNLSCLVITNCLLITKGTLTKDDLSFIVDSLESTSAACSCLVITKNLAPMMKNSATGSC
jgi:hypothetical protein